MFSGQLIDPMNLKPADIRADDICWALAHICRYGGHCHRDYSVGEHTIRVYRRVPVIEALLHDGSEAFLGDVPTPLKRRMPEFKLAEERAARVIAEAFGLNPNHFINEIEHGSVKLADLDALHDEQRFLWNAPHTLVAPSKELVASMLFSELKRMTPRHANFKSLGLDKHTIFS